VQQILKELLPPGALVSQQVDVGPTSISVRLFATKEVSVAKQREAEQAIEKRSGRTTSLSVSSVASQSELAAVMERLTAAPMPQPTPPPVETIDQVRARLLAQISPVLTSIWPPEAPLATFDVTLSDKGVTLDTQYGGTRDLSPIALGMITRQMQQKLDLPDLALNAHRAGVAAKSISRRRLKAR
jgi:hypothetical protein